jgi:hypothetical protein
VRKRPLPHLARKTAQLIQQLAVGEKLPRPSQLKQERPRTLIHRAHQLRLLRRAGRAVPGQRINPRPFRDDIRVPTTCRLPSIPRRASHVRYSLA